ncbi:hypothetical protein [Lachnoclostridium phytofermentans]|uniref:hypothetical protein n=1 Tax=Lachnoclostridium phytofermentans TaxID=66219 RepID=UPI000309CBE5|nr:hypothetical protein [Lachnoclostridium phytofermentans]
MDSLDFDKMQKIQKELQEKYKDKWQAISPKTGRDKLLWMMIEAGEIADVIKKKGDNMIMEDIEVRKHFIEEMCDTLMYFNDVMLCYGISPKEFEEVYLEKHETNMKRW